MESVRMQDVWTARWCRGLSTDSTLVEKDFEVNLLPNREPSAHTVEKIGGTSISNTAAVLKNVLIGGRKGSALYNRIFVVSAYSGMTDLLLEHKKTGKPGAYARFAGDRSRRRRAGQSVLVVVRLRRVLRRLPHQYFDMSRPW